MARRTRSNDWGFPRWRPYGSAGSAPTGQRVCDHVGCSEPGTCPAPKAPNRPERWYFCEKHAADYNRRWNYFAQLSKEEAERERRADDERSRGFARTDFWDWSEGDGTRSRAELDALRLFDLPPDASDAEIKAAYRDMAKANHPDLNPEDGDALKRFHAAQAAYDILRAASARRQYVPEPGD